MKILCAVGARPNFVKIARLGEALKDFEYRIVHMGQHTSDEMSGNLLKQFEITPDYWDLDEAFDEFQPDLLIVVGDVNSARDACIAGKRRGVKIAHIESGLRSFDLRMPEEVNRILIDHMADIHFVTEQSGIDNLKSEGIEGILVGNTMIDTARYFNEEYILFTAHRPSNVDGESIDKLREVLISITAKYKVIFPVHPRTKIGECGADLLPPQDYLSFQKLLRNARLVITDSGGVQEEAAYFRIPCITIRENTERPITLDYGNQLSKNLLWEVDEIMNPIPYWDGKACNRIAEKLHEMFNT